MFRTVPLTIIRSFSLYTQQWFRSYRFAGSLRAGSGWNIPILLESCQQTYANFPNLFLEWNSTCFGQFLCPSSGVFHCTHSNGICHTGLLTACEPDQDRTSRTCSKAVSKPALISQICSWNETLHVSDSSSVHHQEFFTVHTAMVYVIQVCWQLADSLLSANLYDIYHCCVYSEKLLMIDRETVRNM